MAIYKKGTLGWLKEQAKKDGFVDLNKWNQWKREKYQKEHQQEQQEKKKFWKSREYLDGLARRKGFENSNEQSNYRRYIREGVTPVEYYEDCESHIGCIVGENNIANPILDKLFENVYKKKFNNPGYDFICKNPRKEFLDKYPQFKLEKDKEYKIDVKTAHYIDGYWKYRIDYNKIADYFFLIGLGPIGDIPKILLFIHRNDFVRSGKSSTLKINFWKRNAIKIGGRYIEEFNRYTIRNNDV